MTENYTNLKEFKKFIKNSKKIPSPHICINKLIYTSNAICITILQNALIFVKNNLDSKGRLLMKITDLSFDHGFAGYIYEKSSPFVEKFNKLVMQMMEFGIPPDGKTNEKVILHNVKEKVADSENTIIKTSLFILFTGFLTSTIIFIYEMVYFLMMNLKEKMRVE